MQIFVLLYRGTRTLVLPFPLYRAMRLSYRAWLRLTVLDRTGTLLELMPKQPPACPLADLRDRAGTDGSATARCCLGTTAPAEARAEMAPSRKRFIQVYAQVQGQRRLHLPQAVAAATGIDPGAWLRFTLLPDRRALAESVTAAAVVALDAAGFASTRR